MDNYELVRQLMIATNKIDGVYYLCARKMGIQENMLALLYALDDGKNHTQKQVCEEWLIPKTTINTIVKELVSAGYITLLPEGKTREKNIALTESGKKYVDNIMKNIYKSEQQAIKKTREKFSAEFVEAFNYFAD